MPTCYRIVASHRAATAMNGEGSRKHGGRWNPPGAAAVYLTESRALAALEIIVHFGRGAAEASWLVFEVDVPDDLVESPSLESLPAGWNDRDSLAVPQSYGGAWIRSARCAAIMLPSAIIPEERIMILNASHPDFDRVRASEPRSFHFDPRLG